MYRKEHIGIEGGEMMDKLIDRLLTNEWVFNILGGADAYTVENIVFNLITTTVLALFIYFIYRKSFSGVIYSQSFNVTLVMVCIITATVMMTIGSNMALSLGLVGSLSIIRFRTAIKEPRDIAFLFWAIAIGLAAGTGEYLIAITGSLIIALLLLIFNRVIYNDYSYLLVLKGSEIESDSVINILKEYKIPHKFRLKTTRSTFQEVTYEITLKSISTDRLIKSLYNIDNIEEVHIVSYNGEING